MIGIITTLICWGSTTHSSIGSHAFTLLTNDKCSTASFYSKTNSKYKSKMSQGFVDPDTVEKAAGTHYYVYPGHGKNTGQYYKPAARCPSGESARTRLEKHYKLALKYYTSNKNDAFLHLGRACHYLQDIGCPPHAAGIQYPTNPKATNYHALYESYINSVVKSVSHAKTAKSKYGTMNGKQWGIVINDIAKDAASYKKDILTTSHDKYKLTYPCIRESEIYTAVLMDKFAKEAKAEKKNFSRKTCH